MKLEEFRKNIFEVSSKIIDLKKFLLIIIILFNFELGI